MVMSGAMAGLQMSRRTAPVQASPLVPARPGLLQRKCACGGTAGMDGQCAECREKQLGVQRSADRSTGPALAPPIVHDVLRSAGRPLDPATRSLMERRFGHDFSRVRVHDDARAAQSARAVNAHAYTVGGNVVFGPGQFAPATREGARLLAHELAHVVQQSRDGVPSREPYRLGAPTSHHEQEADASVPR
jgi:hypothetical protein